MISATLFGSPELWRAHLVANLTLLPEEALQDLVRALERDLAVLEAAGRPSAPLPAVLAQARSLLAARRADGSCRRSPSRIAVIASLNDAFRGSLEGGLLVLTRAVRSLPAVDQAALLVKVQTFDAFDPNDGSSREHDVGLVEHSGRTWAWKIDAYAPDLEHGSADPGDPTRTVRVLTILLPEES